tara:strand:+ start:217 stop:804 length:588 start_codon:yes stop_codon:yes gene_type:complete
MFNGIIYNIGKIRSIKRNKKSILIGVKTNLKFFKKDIGNSICCDGVCLTLSKIYKRLYYFYLSYETINRSNFKNLKIGKKINLEKSLFYGQTVSGNFTQGHVDTTAVVKKIRIIDKSWFLRLEIKNKKLSKFLVEKATITINGVSLTISKVSNYKIDLNIIPHTLKLTNLKDLKLNDLVNVELDIFGKYIYKYTR